MRKSKKSMALLLASAMMAASLSACGGSEKAEETTALEFTEAAPTTAAATQAAAAETEAPVDPNGDTPSDEGYGILREAQISKIGSLNPLTYINSYSSEQIKRASMILYYYFPNEDYTFCELKVEMAAENPIQVDEEGKVWQIKVREGIVWENGDALDANDVYYTWKMILDPKLANLRASNFAKDVIEIVNANAYFQGECD